MFTAEVSVAGSVKSHGCQGSRCSVPASEYDELHRELQRTQHDAQMATHNRALEDQRRRLTRETFVRETGFAAARAYEEGKRDEGARRSRQSSFQSSQGGRQQVSSARSLSPVTYVKTTVSKTVTGTLETVRGPNVETATMLIPAPTQTEVSKRIEFLLVLSPQTLWQVLAWLVSPLGSVGFQLLRRCVR